MFDTSFGLKTWIIPGLFWGVSTCWTITIILPEMDGELVRWERLYSLPIWLIAGLVMEYFLHKWIYKKGRREIGEKTD